MNWGAIKNFCNYYRRYVGYLTFFSIFSYFFYSFVTPLSSARATSILIGVLIVIWAIVVLAVDEGLKENVRQFEKEQRIQARIKEIKRENTINNIMEAATCLVSPDRYGVFRSWISMENGDPIYRYDVPDFIHEALGIPEEKRWGDKEYKVHSPQFTRSDNPRHQTIRSRKYRPSEEEVKKAFPMLVEVIERNLTDFVDKLLTPPKSLKDCMEIKYIKHIDKLIELLRNNKIDEMDDERKLYNQMN